MLTTIPEIALEFWAGESLLEMSDDLTTFFLGAWVLFLLLREWHEQQGAIASLSEELASVRGKLTLIDERGPSLAREYRDVMQKQFDQWGLSHSEQQVVILMLKGLSFREVAAVRQTREKTVRQQAATVYRKAGLGGRHELAAWFLEDLLEPSHQESQ